MVPDEPGTVDGLKRALAARDRWARAEERTSVLASLTGADYLSLAALFCAWASALLFVSRDPNLGVLAMFTAFAFDKLDGYWARRQGTASALGRQIDSFVDAFAYLLTGALLFHYTLAPNGVVSAVVGFAVLAFGGLRLVRHDAEGFDSRGGVNYYHGTTVVHTNAVVVVNYVLVSLVPAWNGWVAAALVLAAAPLMVSDYRAPKTRTANAMLAVLAVGVAAVCIGLRFGLL